MTTKIFNKKYLNKFTTVLLIFVIFIASFLPIFSPKTHAQFGLPTPTIELPGPLLGATLANSISSGITAGATSVNTLKEAVGDGFAYFAINLVIERLAASTINWINGGFKGSPAYITDPQDYFVDLGDKIAGEFIMKDPRLTQLCGPISAKVRLALTQNYIGDRQWSCTLSQVGTNLENFMDDFSQGGWDNFFEVTQMQQNNPIGAYIQAQNELSLQLNSAQESKKMELQWGRGFLSKKTCARYSDAVAGGTITGERQLIGIDAEGNEIYGDPINQALPDVPPKCIEEKISSPGSVIEEQLNSVLGLGSQRLAVADELNEIIASLLSQLTSKAIGAASSGLRSLSSPETSNNGQTFTNLLSSENNQAIIDQYFADSQQNINDGLQITPPDVSFCHNNPYAPECQPGSPPSSQQQDPCVLDPSDPNCRLQP